ncbi:MAG: signal peptide peptidase SppA [Gemmatimonadetes bacterium]|nr:signal peptide peptidase SppA [Gemmatimonadota bacterium]
MDKSSRNTAIALLVIFGVFGIGVLISFRLLTGDAVLPLGDRVAVVPIEGPILSETAFLDALETFREDGSVRAFVIEVESPGGAVGASQSIYEAIRELRDDDDRPVLAWMGDVGASGGYYAAVGADSVYALPGTLTGSIGVIMEFPNVQELYRKVGVSWEVVKSGEHKDLGSPNRPLDDSDRAILEGLVTDVHEQFVETVAANRPLDRARVAELADGRVYSGRQALELGLIDGLGTLEDVIERAGTMAGLGADPTVVRPQRETADLLDLFDLVGALAGAEARGLLRTFAPTRSATPRLLYEWK